MSLFPTQRAAGGARGPARAIATLLLRVGLTVVFLWAGLAKLRGPNLFAADIMAFRLLPAGATGLALGVAYYLPWLEVLCAAGLWTRRWRGAALGVGAALLTGFTLGLASAWARGIHLDCGCFGAGNGGGTNLPLAVARNLLLLGGCAGLAFAGRAGSSERG